MTEATVDDCRDLWRRWLKASKTKDPAKLREMDRELARAFGSRVQLPTPRTDLDRRKDIALGQGSPYRLPGARNGRQFG